MLMDKCKPLSGKWLFILKMEMGIATRFGLATDNTATKGVDTLFERSTIADTRSFQAYLIREAFLKRDISPIDSVIIEASYHPDEFTAKAPGFSTTLVLLNGLLPIKMTWDTKALGADKNQPKSYWKVWLEDLGGNYNVFESNVPCPPFYGADLLVPANLHTIVSNDINVPYRPFQQNECWVDVDTLLLQYKNMTSPAIGDIFVPINFVPFSFHIPSKGVGILENRSDRLKIYPNPSTGKITVKGKPGSRGSLTVLSSIGQTVYQEEVLLTGQDSKTTLNLNLSKGIYHIQLQVNEQIHYQKLLMQ